MMKQTLSKGFPHIGFLQIAIILLAVITALIHLDLAVMDLMIGKGGPYPPCSFSTALATLSWSRRTTCPLSSAFSVSLAGY